MKPIYQPSLKKYSWSPCGKKSEAYSFRQCPEGKGQLLREEVHYYLKFMTTFHCLMKMTLGSCDWDVMWKLKKWGPLACPESSSLSYEGWKGRQEMCYFARLWDDRHATRVVQSFFTIHYPPDLLLKRAIIDLFNESLKRHQRSFCSQYPDVEQPYLSSTQQVLGERLLYALSCFCHYYWNSCHFYSFNAQFPQLH